MADLPGCEEIRDALVEVAVGIAPGEDRVLAHVARCDGCQRLLSELMHTSDDLLLLAPAQEPPAGFEVRVLSAIPGAAPQRRARRRLVRRLAPALVAALAAAAAAAGGVLVATRDERSLGAQLASVLGRAHGSYIAVARLNDARGRRLGLVFHYGGRPSWVFATLDRPLPRGRYRLTLLRRAGPPAPLGTFTLGPDDRSFGSAATIDLRTVRGLRVRDERRSVEYGADFF